MAGCYVSGMIRLLLGDCRERLAEMEPDSVDAIVCDPPYELGFMGKGWDSSGVAFDVATWAACLRVVKPGGHLIAFGGTRTVHRIAVAIEDAGWTIRDTIHWCYWSGFPKSLDISKEVDRLAGAEREVVGSQHRKATGRMAQGEGGYAFGEDFPITAPATEAARRWSGWGTGIKPAVEPAILARKPLSGSSIARNVLRWGTGALNIDACRFAPGDVMWPGPQDNDDTVRPGNQYRGHIYGDGAEGFGGGHALGRFPANLLYCPKASRAERELGCEGLPLARGPVMNRKCQSCGKGEPDGRRVGACCSAPSYSNEAPAGNVRNHHPTVKPLRLMRYLVRLVTPPGGVCLDPFMGSGTTGMAAVSQGFDFVGVELEAPHIRIAKARISYAAAGKPLEAPAEADEGVTPAAQASLFAPST